MKKILIILTCILLVGCGNKIEENEPNNEINNEINNEVIVKQLQIVDLSSKTRPYAVMINNHPVAQALQSGLNDAYIVYEMITEGGITRLLALFKDSETTRIGSIRSARHYFLDYALENDAIYIHHGQSPQALEDFSKLNLSRIVVLEGTTGWRDKELKNNGIATEHTLFTSIEKLNSGLKDKRTELNKDLLLNYSVEEIDLSSKNDSIKADDVLIKYSNTQTNNFKYDSSKKLYVRYSNGAVRQDYITKEDVTVKNIITYQVKNTSIDSYGRQTLDNIGSGKGYYITNGYAVPITWEKTSRESQTVYKYLNGEEIVLNDGNTYIEIQPLNKTLQID